MAFVVKTSLLMCSDLVSVIFRGQYTSYFHSLKFVQISLPWKEDVGTMHRTAILYAELQGRSFQVSVRSCSPMVYGSFVLSLGNGYMYFGFLLYWIGIRDNLEVNLSN